MRALPPVAAVMRAGSTIRAQPHSTCSMNALRAARLTRPNTRKRSNSSRSERRPYRTQHNRINRRPQPPRSQPLRRSDKAHPSSLTSCYVRAVRNVLPRACGADFVSRRAGEAWWWPRWAPRRLGVAFYDDRDAHVVREAAAAHDSPWVRCVREHALLSRLVVAHIRKATVGARTLANTQPFARELGARIHVFAHNGHLPYIASDPRFVLRSFRPVGETDSERAFCALLARVEPLWRQSGAAPQALDRYAILASFAKDLRSLGPANFLYSDGELLVAHADRRVQDNGRIAPPGLWVLERECPATGVHAATRGVTVESQVQRVVLVASVPLSSEAWRPCSEGELVVLKGAQIVRTNAR